MYLADPVYPGLFYNHLMCQVSGVMCQNICFPDFCYTKKIDKVVELVGGGSVINGAHPV